MNPSTTRTPGSGHAADDLLSEVYDRLRRMAAAMVEHHGASVPATAVVHEAWLRLDGGGLRRWRDRATFLTAAARAIRWVLVDRARRRLAATGAERRAVSAEEVRETRPNDRVMVELDEALRDLKRAYPRRYDVVLLRSFGGLSVEEAAAALRVSVPTVKRDWHFARAWLLRDMMHDGTTDA